MNLRKMITNILEDHQPLLSKNMTFCTCGWMKNPSISIAQHQGAVLYLRVEQMMRDIESPLEDG